MSRRPVLSIFICALVLLTSGCATRYQDLLRDRDAEIRDLQAKLANSRSESEDFQRQLSDARTNQVNATPASTSDNELERIRGELPDLNVNRRRGRISIGIENTVTFDSGSKDLKSSASSMLRRVSDLLGRDYADRRIYVEGHTDTDPIKRTREQFRSNRHLSMERADAVASWLIATGGIPERQLAVVGYGPYDPREAGSTDTAKTRNRRVEIVVGEILD